MGLESAETVFAVETCLKELAMTDFQSRWLVLSAVGTAFVFAPLPSACIADDDVRSVGGRQAEWIVRIGNDRAETSESTGIVISPSSQIAGEQASQEPGAPILVAPSYDEEPEAVEATKKPVKRSVKASDKAPMATETASEKAREEWQKKRPVDGQKRQTKNQASVESKKADKVKNEAASPRVSDKVSGAGRSKISAVKAAMAGSDSSDKAMAAKAAAERKAAAAKVKSDSGHTQSGSASNTVGVKDARSYREIYNSIPFSRTEYDANPGYRHQATMEIMLGQLHPIIVAPPALPRQESTREVTVRFLPSIRPGYRAWSRYPWH